MINKKNTLTPEILSIVQHKSTETACTGTYNAFDKSGTFLCRQCGLALFRSTDKFSSRCGWPAFDDSIAHAVGQCLDQDKVRTEIVCQRCDAHLGHVFTGEGLTKKNARYCVNSLSLDFVDDTDVTDTEEAIVAGGCFWGVEHLLKKVLGVVHVESGYTGGYVDHPSYEQVCSHSTGHLEAVRVLFNPNIINFEGLLKRFLEIHDPTQGEGQGPDRGEQYQSAIFHYNDSQKIIADMLMNTLIKQGLHVTTKLLPVSVFWPAESYHQAYYQKMGTEPYCHKRVKRFT